MRNLFLTLLPLCLSHRNILFLNEKRHTIGKHAGRRATTVSLSPDSATCCLCDPEQVTEALRARQRVVVEVQLESACESIANSTGTRVAVLCIWR